MGELETDLADAEEAWIRICRLPEGRDTGDRSPHGNEEEKKVYA